MPLEYRSTAVFSFKHFQKLNLVIQWSETKNFEGRDTEGGIKVPLSGFDNFECS